MPVLSQRHLTWAPGCRMVPLSKAPSVGARLSLLALVGSFRRQSKTERASERQCPAVAISSVSAQSKRQAIQNRCVEPFAVEF